MNWHMFSFLLAVVSGICFVAGFMGWLVTWLESEHDISPLWPFVVFVVALCAAASCLPT